MKIGFLKLSCYRKKPVGMVWLFSCLLHIVAENMVTDRHTNRTSTVVLAVRACQAKILNAL